ncbi:MAG: T9SS type A sorting domain-containing protein [Bacteroidetes bacterium]|nr:T9SS type A sorting domain-containing protein [Bacteroidota bacterium]
MKHFYLLSFYFLLSLSLLAQQPQWQWANRGGSPYQQGSDEEYADDIEVDAQGNTYVTGRIYASASFGHTYTTPFVTSYGMLDIFLSKYDCSGNLLWVNILGSAGNDWPNGLEIGKDGMIYLFGMDGAGTLNIKTDSATVAYSFSTPGAFLCKFNQNGLLHKFKKFDPTRVSNFKARNFLNANADGTITICANISAGTIAPSFNVVDGTYIANLDTGLNVLSIFPISIVSLTPTIIGSHIPRFTTIPKNIFSNAYIIGTMDATQDSSELGGIIFRKTNGAFANGVAAKFSSTGTLLWYKVGISADHDIFEYPTCDAYDNPIFRLQAKNGDTVLNYPYHTGTANENFAIIKLGGINGDAKYGITSNNSSTVYPSTGFQIISRTNNTLSFTMQLKGNYVFDTISVYCDPSNAQPLIWEFKDLDTAFQATTNYTIINGNGSTANRNIPNAFTVDEQGNAYVTGITSGAIYTATDTIQATQGTSKVDMFVAKYGLPCTDTTPLIAPLAPSQLIADATAANAITVTWADNSQYEQRFRIYRSLDSINYIIYDSVPANITTYIDLGVLQNTIYWYKAAAVNNIGASNFTNADSAIIIPTSVPKIETNIQLLVQPNPNNGNFVLVAATTETSIATLKIFAADGRQIQQENILLHSGNNQFEINTGNTSAGLYIIVLNTGKGNTRLKFIIK